MAHYGLPINRVVQIALRHLHRQVFPGQYAHDDSSAAELAAEAVSGLGALTQHQAAEVLSNSSVRGAELARRLNLKQGEMILTLADFFARIDADAAASADRTGDVGAQSVAPALAIPNKRPRRVPTKRS